MTTPQFPRYQGRPLPRPDDEVQDQGLGFDVVTLLNRRRLFGLLGVGAATAGLAACGVSAASGGSGTDATAGAATTEDTSGLTEIPDETAGPYPGDGSNGPDVLEQSGVIRSDIRSSFDTGSATAEGVPLTITLNVLDIAGGGAPFAGVAVYAWHCDRDGRYSMYATGLENENYLRGVQLTDANGSVSFTSIFPGCYSGRWPHVHFEVYPDQASITDASAAIATSQLAFPQNVCEAVYATTGYDASVGNLASVSLTGDNVFGDDGGVHQLATMTGNVTGGYTATLTVPIDTTTAPSSGGGGGGGQGGPGGGPGGTPPSGGPPR